MKAVDVRPFPESEVPCYLAHRHVWVPVTNYGVVTEFLECSLCGATATDADMLDPEDAGSAKEGSK